MRARQRQHGLGLQRWTRDQLGELGDQLGAVERGHGVLAAHRDRAAGGQHPDRARRVCGGSAVALDPLHRGVVDHIAARLRARVYHTPRMRLLITGAGGMLGQDLVGAGVAAGHEMTALTRGELDITDAESARRAIVPARSRRGDQLRGLDRRRRRRERRPSAALAVNGTGAGNVAARGGRGRRLDDPRSRPTTCSTGHKRDAVRRVRPGRAALRVRPLEARRRARGGRARRPTATRSSAPRGCSASAAAASRRRSCGSRPSATS